MEKVSCIIGTKNAEIDIRECLESVRWADEIIIIDDFSIDKTLEIARGYTHKIFQKKFSGYPEQKEYGLKKTSYRWVLSLDADERVSLQLRDEILERMSGSIEFSGFLMRRLNIFLGRQVKHCGWYEADNLRLFDKHKVGYDLGIKYLESMKVSGNLAVLNNDLLHYTCRSLDDYLKRVNLWSSLNTLDLITKGISITAFNGLYYFGLKPAAVFLGKYFIKGGFRDGFAGFLISFISAVTYFLSYAKLLEAQRGRKR